MKQNTSSAVMQQKHDHTDTQQDYPTPPFATRALCEWLNKNVDMVKSDVVWEPACNRGCMARPLKKYFPTVIASDLYHYGDEHYEDAIPECMNFLERKECNGIDWVITNPPFTLAAEFIKRALEVSKIGVAVIVRSAFLEGKDRYNTLFSVTPPTYVLQFVERVPMVKGTYDPKASSATAYSWLVWLKDSKNTHTILDWIPPCRKQLERESDYK